MKPKLISLSLSARLKPCPCYKTRQTIFSTRCEAVLLLQSQADFSARCEDAPIQNLPFRRIRQTLLKPEFVLTLLRHNQGCSLSRDS